MILFVFGQKNCCKKAKIENLTYEPRIRPNR